MNVIKHIIEEEVNRLEKLSAKYKSEMEKLPKGSISKKNRNGKLYIYLVYRENKKIKFKYIGKESSNKVKRLEEKIRERRRYKHLLKQLKMDLKEVRRAINGKKV
jgi:hypothetical protein